MGPTCLPSLNTCEVTGDVAPGPSRPVSTSLQTFGEACFTEMTLPSFHLSFPDGSDSKESACNAGDLDLIPGLGGFPWRRKWQPTPVFLPGESYGQRSLAGCNRYHRSALGGFRGDLVHRWKQLLARRTTKSRSCSGRQNRGCLGQHATSRNFYPVSQAHRSHASSQESRR